MSKRKQTWLAILAVICLAALIGFPAAALRWAKWSAHRQMNKLTPEERLNLNVIPATITLPPVGDASPLDVMETDLFILRFPPAQTKELRQPSVLLTYPQFHVLFFNPFSSAAIDAEFQKLYRQNSYDHQLDVYRARPDDIDSQPNLAALRNHLLRLSDKLLRFSYTSCFDVFSQADRQGFVIAQDPLRHKIIVNITFLASQTSCGIYFSNDSGVDPRQVEDFLARIQINPKSPSTLPVKK